MRNSDQFEDYDTTISFNVTVIVTFRRKFLIFFVSVIGGAKGSDYEVLRLSNATWESIPFTVSSKDADNEQPIRTTTDNNHLDTSQPPLSTSQPEEFEDEDEDGPASIQTDNTLSSLRHFVETAGKGSETLLKVFQNQQNRQKSMAQLSAESSSTPSQRTSAFDPDLSLQLEGKTGDFYRVERQRFKKITNSFMQSSVFEDGKQLLTALSICKFPGYHISRFKLALIPRVKLL